MNREGKKCVLYPRVSTEMQVDGYSLEGQKNSLKRFADREEMEIVGIYEDAGKSGKSIEGRPAFKKMLSDIKNGLEIDYILVYKLSRFGRNAADILNSLEFVQSYGINLICIEEGIDSSQTSGKLLISVLSAVAEIERENIIEQTMNGRREKARQGGWNGGFAPYGYYLKDNQLLIEETEAEAIRIIFDKFANSDVGLGGVAKYLNLQGIKKIPRQNGTLETWSSHFIRLILDNPVYCGKIAYGRRTREKVKGTKNEYKQVHTDDYILEDGQHEGIVSEELWQKAHTKRMATGIKQPSKIGKDRSHLLTGILKCPICGSSMYTNKHAWTNKDGTYKEVYYYICGRNKQERGHHCDYKASLRKTDIEPLVIEAVKELVSDKYFAKEIEKRIGVQTDTTAIDKELANYESKLKEVDLNKARLEREIDNLPIDARFRERKIHDMTLRLDGLYDTIVELEERIEDAKLRRSSIEMEAITLDNIYKLMLNFGKLYDIISDEEKKNLITYLIKEIQIYPNGESEMPLKSIEFNFPIYRDGQEVRRLLWEKGNTVETQSVPFEWSGQDWQCAVGTIVPKRSGKTVRKIIIYCAYDYNSGTAWFDNISLRQEPVQTYTYNEKGNLSAATQTDTRTESYGYNTSGVDLTSYTAMSGIKYTYTYNSQHDVKTESGGGLTNEYTYDSSGNITQSHLSASNTKALISKGTLTADRNHTASTTDVNGTMTSYTYNTTKELLASVSSPDPSQAGGSVVTNHTYVAANDRPNQTYINGVVAVAYGYQKGALSSLSRKTFRNGVAKWQQYGFSQDNWGNMTGVAVSASTDGTSYSGTRTLATYAYANNNGNLTKMTYGNGHSVSYTYDIFDRVTSMQYNDTGIEVLYTYNAEGSLATESLRKKGTVTSVYSYEYDSLGRLIRSREMNGSTTAQRTELLYDTANRLVAQNYNVGSTDYTTSYTYSSTDGTLSSMKTAAGATINYTYDGLKRLQMAAATSGSATVLTTKYAYRDINGTQTTAQPQYYKVIQGNGDGLSSATILEGAKHTYDAAGNITKIQESISPFRTLAVYAYDKQSQLTGATYYTYSGSSTTPTTTTAYAYTYDGAGNILTEKKNGATVRTYTYGDSGWNDLLTKVNGTTIGYDAIGNPTNYYNGVKTMTNLTWVQGRQLKQLTVGGAAVSYTYDANGIRTEKSAGGVTYEYITQSGKLVREKATKGSKVYVMDFFYDNNGLPFAVNFSSDGGASFKTYYYVLNLQGDVVKLVNSSGTTAAQYTYDAWGTVTSILNANGNEIVNNTSGSAIAFWNPLTYRGYIRDIETGFYYLQSRYYDPVLHRFINADLPEYTTLSSVSTASANLFAYCVNNPVNLHDENGEWPSWAKKLVAVVAVAAAVVTATVVTVATFGAGSVAGVAMISATATLAARTTEVVALQVKKGKQEGKSTSQIVKDSFESVYDNGKRIVGFTPATKGASITFNHLLSKSVSKIFDETVTIRQTLKSTGGKVIPYAFAALAWVRTGVSIFSDDPVKRASQRGYTLK